MDDQTLLRAVLVIAAVSLLINVYTLNEVRSSGTVEGAPANYNQAYCFSLCSEFCEDFASTSWEKMHECKLDCNRSCPPAIPP